MVAGGKLRLFDLMRAILVPVSCLALLIGLAAWFNDYVPVGRTLGFLPYSIADKLLTVGLWGSFLLLLYRFTVTVGLDLVQMRNRHQRLPEILRTMIAGGYVLVAVVVILYVCLDGQMSGILALSGVFGIVIGIALRPIILDVFSGLSANLEAAFHIGDWVSVEGGGIETYQGWVEQVNWRTTRIRTRSGNLVVFPNSYLSTSIVTNNSRPHAQSRYEIKLKLPPEIPTERALPVLEQAVAVTLNKPRRTVREAAPDVLITSITGSGVEYWVRFWLDPSQVSYDSAIHLVNCSMHRHLRMAGIPLATEREQVYHAPLPSI